MASAQNDYNTSRSHHTKWIVAGLFSCVFNTTVSGNSLPRHHKVFVKNWGYKTQTEKQDLSELLQKVLKIGQQATHL